MAVNNEVGSDSANGAKWENLQGVECSVSMRRRRWGRFRLTRISGVPFRSRVPAGNGIIAGASSHLVLIANKQNKRRRSIDRSMSGYENIVGGKLKLKGKALDVKAGSLKKKKKKHVKKQVDSSDLVIHNDLSAGQSVEEAADDPNEEDVHDGGKTSEEGKTASYIDHLTPAERRYIEQRERIDVHRMAKEADKSHRDRIQDFNQYLANMSEHYDIPKVGPG
ncbi:hypothetical protein OIU78_005967 [Salix suchowensis]|nr:hypothetical protein OIU78_005967 [Salix suchowensis]